MDVRIGVTYSAKEIDLELDDDVDRDELRARIESAVGVPSDKVAYVEIGGPDSERRIGFGSP